MTVEEWKQKNPPIQRKPFTNEDRIRAMSDDDDLAEWFYNNTTMCPPGQSMKECIIGTKYCLNCWLDWLKQEAKDGN